MNKASDTTSLYIHIPFCLKKCPYCDFFSVPIDSAEIGSYADLLVKHLHLLSKQFQPKRLESVFFGGGTPSLLPPADVGRILQTAEERFGFTADIEISLEANPGTVNADNLAGFRSAGINRLSIGVQSLCDRNLHLLDRPHTATEAEAAIGQARQAGFTNLSCDLMFALPGQNLPGLQDDLARILGHNPEHLSLYGLTIEAGTPFEKLHRDGAFEEVDEELYEIEYRHLHEALLAAGYEHYEISNFARPGYACRHNLRYWKRRANLAIGAGAHGFAESGWGERRAVPDDLDGYVTAIRQGRDPAVVIERFDRQAAMAESLFLGLRTAAGVDAAQFRRSFDITLEEAFPEAVARCGNLLENVDDRWRLNLDGWLLFNTLLTHFQ